MGCEGISLSNLEICECKSGKSHDWWGDEYIYICTHTHMWFKKIKQNRWLEFKRLIKVRYTKWEIAKIFSLFITKIFMRELKSTIL